MYKLLSQFLDIAEDIFQSLEDENLVHCKEAVCRSFLSFMETKALNFGRLINTKQDTPEMLKKIRTGCPTCPK
jgi:hypothetical protein